MARYKMGPQGVYYDANDTGPDQASPDEITAYQQQQGQGGQSGQPSAAVSASPVFQTMSGMNSGATTQSQAPTQPNSPSPTVPNTTSPYSFNPSNASPTTGINGTGGATQAQGQSYQNGWTPQANNAPPGFDGAKWADTTHNSPKYTVGRIMASGGTIQQAAAAVGATVIAPDKIQYPDGTIVDLVFDIGGTGQHLQYTEVGGPGGGGGSPTAPSIPGGGMSPFGGGQTSLGGSSQPGAAGPTSNEALRQFLMSKLSETAQPIDANDPRLKGQVDAYRNEQERSLREGRDALAERSTFQGLPSGSVDAAIQGSYQKMGENVGKFSADTLAKEYDQQRTSLNQLLALAVQSGDTQTAQQIQLYLGQLDAAYREKALGQQNNQFYDNFAYGIGKDQNTIDKGVLDLLANG